MAVVKFRGKLYKTFPEIEFNTCEGCVMQHFDEDFEGVDCYTSYTRIKLGREEISYCEKNNIIYKEYPLSEILKKL